jgi:Ca2+-binding RTX toxin-like protein
MVGDNASVARPERVSGSGLWWRLANVNFDVARRIVTMEKTPEAAGAFGDDTMSGGEAVDDMYGQLGNDNMSGNEGEDAMVGDLGLITNNLIDGGGDGLADPGAQQLIAPNAPFFDPGETVYPTASLYRQVELYAFDSLLPDVGAGDDTMSGGDGHDSMHGGPGADVMTGNTGDDYMFGDDSTLVTFPVDTYSPVGADALWGGPGHDTMFGGHGVDYLDVLPRPSFADKKGTFPQDPASWFAAAATDAVQPDGHAGAYSGLDIMYGGWDRDWMQLDVSGPGPPPGDRALDWNGGFNAYYRCDASYGDWGITRQHSPSMQAFLQNLARGMGAVQTSTAGTSGYDETAMVFPGDKDNANPVNPDNPAHFTCGVPHS